MAHQIIMVFWRGNVLSLSISGLNKIIAPFINTYNFLIGTGLKIDFSSTPVDAIAFMFYTVTQSAPQTHNKANESYNVIMMNVL